MQSPCGRRQQSPSCLWREDSGQRYTIYLERHRGRALETMIRGLVFILRVLGMGWEELQEKQTNK